ncbi:hypothetical protein TIFTF001_000877 [Ficus carica]|uniref:Uncharacterized protein n=1 Tax=Ficus carica TaxID=3494 RepID=A0AA87ZJF4_FICCA|nr:hypothetical protein TIFTF001_000877 [Ficus carica]
MHSRILGNTLYKKNSDFLLSSVPSQYRSIFSTTQLQSSWTDKIKGIFTGKKSPEEGSQITSDSFTLLRFADELKKAKRMGTFKQYVVGRSSEATFADAFEKQEAIIRYLGGFDATGENLQTNHKQEAAKQCNCSIADVENALAKFTWAKEAQMKIENLKKEGKPMPKSLAEVQRLMDSTPLDLARSNLAKSGQISAAGRTNVIEEQKKQHPVKIPTLPWKWSLER